MTSRIHAGFLFDSVGIYAHADRLRPNTNLLPWYSGRLVLSPTIGQTRRSAPTSSGMYRRGIPMWAPRARIKRPYPGTGNRLSEHKSLLYHLLSMSESSPMFETTRDSSGQLLLRKDLKPHFENAGLKSFSDWMSLAGVDIREVSMRPTRPVVALRVPGVREELFVKRHLEPARPVGLFQKLGLSRPISEARKEAENLEGFRDAGIPCPEIAAWGEGVWEGDTTASFLVTKDLEALPLERYLFHNWKRPVIGNRATDKRRLTIDLAILARRMHRAGWVHRDFYLGHIFVRGEPCSPGERLAVIDVQRASRRPRWWIRSRIKDLASLHFSADPKYIRWTDRVRFLKAYWETDRFSLVRRFQIAWILRKAERIRRHTEKAMGIPYSDFFNNKYY